MDGEEGGGIRLSKRFSDKGGEVDFKTKSGTAWSHSYLNQKPWHPLSYPNQRRKWIAEQIQNQRQRRTEEYAQEQEFFRQAALISKKEKEKIETMKAVSFMYVRPPGYNAESAKAAELADESMREGRQDGPSTSMQRPSESVPPSGEEAKKPRPKDVFGRRLPTEQEFEVLKNAPRLETGVPTRAKPFGVEVRNVKCVRCGTFGHQSGDRECPLKDAIMPNEESRLKRDDPLTAILAHIDPSEPLKWELKQKPGISPPRGGFRPDDPNQQIVAEEDIFNEYGGFLGEDVIPELLANFSSKPKKKSKKKTRHKGKQSPSSSGEDGSSSDEDDKRGSKKKGSKLKRKKHYHSESSSSEMDRHKVKNKDKESYSFKDLNYEKHHRSTKNRPKHSHSFEDSDVDRWQYRRDKNRDRGTDISEDSGPDKNQRGGRSRGKHSYSFEDLDHEKHRKSTMSRDKHSHSYKDSEIDRHNRRDMNRDGCAHSTEDSEPDRHRANDKRRHRHSYSSEDSEPDKHHKSDKRRHQRHWHSYSSEDSDRGRQNRSEKSRGEHCYSYNETEEKRHHRSRNSRHKH
ncbi:hypothetical protein M0R45_012260 [Rubus argutus]|uniref:CBF1-interacting co-repressor CIR N-terminal domain-containing protein n=1 Tax=Rubus argutus TaxID=59490 RepID=A0AAW1YFR6_RUBAR